MITLEAFFFYLFAAVTIVSALLVVTRKNPVISIIFLCVTLVTMAGIFVMLEAYFIAVVQILVYAGAIMVLFIFVVMLLNAGNANPPFFIRSPVRSVAILIVGFLAIEIIYILIAGSYAYTPLQTAAIQEPPMGDNTLEIARILFKRYIFPFEIASVLLLVAMIGAVILSKGASQ